MENKIADQQKKRLFIPVLAVMVVIFFVGFSVGNHDGFPKISQNIAGTHNSSNTLETYPTSKDFRLFFDVWEQLEEKYPFDDAPSVSDRIMAATEGLAQAYDDPYTVFFPPEDTQSFTEEIEGQFGGVGMEVGMRNGFVTVIAPLKGSPAEKMGVLSGDILTAVDGENVLDTSVEEVIQKIRGEVGTSVQLTFLREGETEPVQITIQRDIIQIPTLEIKIQDDVFIISLFNFSEQAPSEFHDALIAFEQSGTHKLILDMRGNPGGFLEGAIDIASWFLPEGKVIVRESTGDSAKEIVYRSRGYGSLVDPSDMIVLVDFGSASASEIVAGALSEHDVATLVGAQTFGKGSVQEFIPIRQNSSLKVTVAKWLTPHGISISEKGLTPEYQVEFTTEDYQDGHDPQLEKALELLHAE